MSIVENEESDSNSKEMIVTGTSDNFHKEVVESSREVMVLVDFWADWCAPCKQLLPHLEEAVRRSKGKVKLVKINVDEEKNIASQLQIQSLPTVYVFVDGEPVDGFVGVVGPAEIEKLVEKYAKRSASDIILEIIENAEEKLASESYSEALELLNAAYLKDKDSKIVVALAYTYTHIGDLERAKELCDSLSSKDIFALQGVHRNRYEAVLAKIKLADRKDEELSPAASTDVQTQKFINAKKLLSEEKYEESIEILLEIVGEDKSWNDEQAYKLLLDVFAAKGASDSVVVSARKRLSSILFN